MTVSRITLDDCPSQPWKNGGGTTSEVAADANDPPGWRISLATIDKDGPFSDFRGYDRTILSIHGDPIELTVDGEITTLRPCEPFAFRGESTTTCRLTGGAARDLNVMTRRDEYAHDVEIVTELQRFVVDEDELVFAHAIDGSAVIAGTACTTGDTLYLDGAERFDVAPDAGAHVCVVRITPR
jgi:environmental stress-induced protein Ves